MTPWRHSSFHQLTGPQLVIKFPVFCGIRRFITAHIKARHLLLSWARSIQSMSLYLTTWSFILTLFFHLRLDLLGGLFNSGHRHQYSIWISPASHTCHMSHPSHPYSVISQKTYLRHKYQSFVMKERLTKCIFKVNYIFTISIFIYMFRRCRSAIFRKPKLSWKNFAYATS
jgi:hypothetical protein